MWQNMTNTPTVSDYFWAFSNDEEWFYFSSQAENLTSEADVFRMRLDGTQRQLLSHIPAYGTFVDWSPDGEWLWFIIRLDRERKLYRLSTISGTLEQMTDLNILQTEGWAGNDEWFIFTASNGSESDTYRINVDGTDASPFSCPKPCGFSPEFSADRTKIMVSTCEMADCNTELFLIDIADNRVTQLANSESNRFLLEWLPDGDKITYVRVSSNADRFQRHYFIADVDAQNPIPLTQSNDFAVFVEWSPDGEWFVFEADSYSGYRSFYRIRSDGTDRQQLTHNKKEILFHTWSIGTVYVWNRLQSFLFSINLIGGALLICFQSHQRESKA
jgi:Tol biopolymer transport system component